jgi:hypothetical protein
LVRAAIERASSRLPRPAHWHEARAFRLPATEQEIEMTEAQHKVVIASLVVIGLVLAYVMLD